MIDSLREKKINRLIFSIHYLKIINYINQTNIEKKKKVQVMKTSKKIQLEMILSLL